ncbi:MAG: hypothetical protein GXX96_38080 [Planctomycetaceae bacterium]|nr:hypothetical protein [Planctomycetaceae bacterium]
MATQKHLADYLGLSDRQVRRHIAAGMPANPEQADAWYRSNVCHARPTATLIDPESLAAFFDELAAVVKDAAYHFIPDRTPETLVDALIGDVLLYSRDFAREAGVPFRPDVEQEIQARFGLSHAEKAQADARAAQRWRTRAERNPLT